MGSFIKLFRNKIKFNWKKKIQKIQNIFEKIEVDRFDSRLIALITSKARWQMLILRKRGSLTLSKNLPVETNHLKLYGQIQNFQSLKINRAQEAGVRSGWINVGPVAAF